MDLNEAVNFSLVYQYLEMYLPWLHVANLLFFNRITCSFSVLSLFFFYTHIIWINYLVKDKGKVCQCYTPSPRTQSSPQRNQLSIWGITNLFSMWVCIDVCVCIILFCVTLENINGTMLYFLFWTCILWFPLWFFFFNLLCLLEIFSWQYV